VARRAPSTSGGTPDATAEFNRRAPKTISAPRTIFRWHGPGEHRRLHGAQARLDFLVAAFARDEHKASQQFLVRLRQLHSVIHDENVSSALLVGFGVHANNLRYATPAPAAESSARLQRFKEHNHREL
jgi:hypothetical protein